MKMNKVFMVVGDDGFDGHGGVVFGMYPTIDLAEARLKVLESLYKKGIDGAKYMSTRMVEVGADGADFRVAIGG
jgi:hypothetical protein